VNALHVPTAGLFCVPAAVEIITGDDPESVIFPAFNRRTNRSASLHNWIAGTSMGAAADVLEELGYHVRRYKGDRLRALVRDWAKRFPDRIILVAADRHCLVLHAGKVHDSWEPLGKDAAAHPFHNARVNWAALIQPK
jgi:hypothetical protein